MIHAQISLSLSTIYVYTLVGLRTFCMILGPRTCSLRTCEHAFTNMSFYRTVAHEHSEHTNMLRTCPRTCEHMLTRTSFTNMIFYRTVSKTACLRTYVHLEHARTRVHEHTFTNMTNIRTYVHGETKIYIYIYLVEENTKFRIFYCFFGTFF